jgi:hypothetical protein
MLEAWGDVIAVLREAYDVVAEQDEALLVEVTLVLTNGAEHRRRVRIARMHRALPIVTFDAALGPDAPHAAKELLDAGSRLRVGAMAIDRDDVPIVRHREWLADLTPERLDRAVLAVAADAWDLEEHLRQAPATADLFAYLT